MSKLAVITGASSGIGESFAHHLSKDHDSIWLCGRNESALSIVASDISKRYGVETKIVLSDLSKASDITSLSKELRSVEVSTLVNNAGYAEDGAFDEIPLTKHKALMRVHVEAPLAFCHAVLPKMKLSQSGSIINVASVASWIASPASPLYAPSKTFLRSFSETLAADYFKHGIKIQALCPGFTITEFHKKMGINVDDFYKSSGFMRSWTADYVVQSSLKDLETGASVSIPGWNYKLIVFALRHLPMWILQRMFRTKLSRYRNDHQTDS